MYYSQLSDFEINKRLADIALNGTWHVKPSHPENKTGGWLYGSNGVYTRDLPDYCTSPDDAWPLVTKNKISLVWIEDTSAWCASSGGNAESEYWGWDECPDFYYEHANPLRAAMIVFLMMQDANNA
ncbi:DUF2591 domain-containing protein [Salmonella enterica subsp. enterica serovar Minnesota]|uniref:phage protein NinX family protein n=1 Tax=Salmonella enterica TaxID=28901 RepID=UPI00107958D9|nr:DUF2591 domain-containing protein [Salmonella enterica subsp. enterica serovar Minnesota]EEF0858908.1 DUF2591 domain-containing protein [Salmonella enterica subsp. enterica serovar Heidelberg]EAC0137407.1 DUF2591 domain-containing protein [Salmonella enterica subsp. enterica serovar Minnesota]EBX8692061.1 DUF2591 domain-containing protein [Salmonella enterica subsp. enterica serovar Minnesota]EBX9514139.1 DUF2591 domain-containing protein [Salmonella enterica subsp. enterica serovar Minnesot